MKRVMMYAFLVVCFTTILCVSSGSAKNPLYKLGRGCSNCWTSQYEYTDAVHEQMYRHGPIGFFTGSLKGLALGIVRAAAGIYDVATFPIPIPWKYESIYEPEVNL